VSKLVQASVVLLALGVVAAVLGQYVVAGVCVAAGILFGVQLRRGRQR
jgi:hypothetical protein